MDSQKVSLPKCFALLKTYLCQKFHVEPNYENYLFEIYIMTCD